MQPEDENLLVSAAASGSDDALGRLLAGHRERLKRVVRARLNPRLSARVDSSDVVQEVLTDAACAFAHYLQLRPLKFFTWLRRIAERRVIDLHRRHLDAARRSVRRETPAAEPASDSHNPPPAWLADSQTSPSQQLVRTEELAALQAGLERLSEADREVIALRYGEQLSMPEVAQALNISLPAAKSRHLRAIARLTEVVKQTLQQES
jgi:RNA polymerase sigma-70 factor (ECF subfamily)